jgi:DNA adenine methylase
MTLELPTIKSKPFLKWAGGKTKLVPIISDTLGSATRLVEPFAGSGAVFMGTSYKSYLLCDSNADLIGLFNNLKTSTNLLLLEIERLFTGMYNTESAFYELREEFNQLEAHDIRKSAIFVYLNKHAFNGLCRYNSKGGFNVPYGRYKSPSSPITELNLFAKKSQIAEFKCLDFIDAFNLINKNDVVYCDPPYVPISATSNFTSYAKGIFNETNQRELANQAILAKNKGIRVVISNHDTNLTREIYLGSTIKTLNVRRSISSKASTRGDVKEIIAIY